MGLISGTLSLLGLTALGAGIPTVHTVLDVRGKTLWREYVVAAEARGEVLNLEEILNQAPIPDGQNFASIPRLKRIFEAQDAGVPAPPGLGPENIDGLERTKFAREQLIGRSMCQPLPLRRWIPEKVVPPDELDYVANKLAIVAADLDAIAAAAQLKHCRFPLHWHEGLAMETPHYGPLRSAASSFALRASVAIRKNEPEQATASTLAAIRIGNHLRGEPTILASLVCLSIRELGISSLWEGLQKGVWTDAHLQRLKAVLAGIRVDEEHIATMRGERALMSHVFIDFAEGHQGGQAMEVLTGRIPAWAGLIPEGVWHEAAWGLCHLIDMAYFSQPRYAGCSMHKPDTAALVERIHQWRTLPSPGRIMAAIAVPVFGPHSKRMLKAEADLRLARIAIALERAKLANGAYPDKLTELAPAFLPELPVDPISGKPFHYRLRNDRPAIWSNGLNETNEGGRPKKNLELGDWCWQYSLPGGYGANDYFSDAPIKLP